MTAPSPSQGVSALTVLVGLALEGHRVSSSHHWVTMLDQDLHLLCRLWVLFCGAFSERGRVQHVGSWFPCLGSLSAPPMAAAGGMQH